MPMNLYAFWQQKMDLILETASYVYLKMIHLLSRIELLFMFIAEHVMIMTTLLIYLLKVHNIQDNFYPMQINLPNKNYLVNIHLNQVFVKKEI
jgi:hypothetical protein